ncbi:MAG TPA: hypothetical protein VFG42_24755 [Baekduia sp.]|uniref:hypothetical protein n=1 Tax=Baekduia sp. TaxID=2600305 RepID=UPI002D784416|nr:hypothetical protein [Baekduia sp.]HET6510028.1 hypothetical protein [Baekduia sp.]
MFGKNKNDVVKKCWQGSIGGLVGDITRMHFIKWKNNAGTIAIKPGGTRGALAAGCVSNVLETPGL